MNRDALKNILQNAYDRDQWISTLQFLTGKRDLLTVNLSPREIEIHTQEADRIIKTFYQIGTVKTSDGVSLPIFEIVLEDAIRIEQNRVGVNEFIKKYIIKDAVKGALTTFSYDHNHEKSEWRFSFISKNSANDFFAEAEAIETNPKKFTYIFGNKETHRTAIERLYNLEQSRFRLEDFFEAFNVEPVSKKFFDDYKKHYEEISEFLIESKYFPLFEKKDDENHKPEKEVRNFVSRLMGRIVFLYFLQKKHWLGASNTDYTDGNPNFLSDLFFNDTKNQNDFYQKYLCPIFFNALNTPDRKNDEFQLENGEKVSIPFLNGGLFEEEQEPNDHRTIKFPKYLFEELFKFFNGYNFTIYENSPEEHTVAVDPEMLGHIFENLIDYNKDTGTFYTPKEIVQYMTQESLTEYLATHLEKERDEIEQMIKNQSVSKFSDAELQEVENLLDAVKICDPAIGSGAFPMGMLQEVFNLKALIAFRLKNEWKPAQVKQNIIQNSIYGVDLDEGAVEIARLRFWLSLVVDEGKPKALPNLDYKIMQGNSVVESYRGVDLSKIASGNDLQIIEDLQTDLFGNLVNDQMKMTIGKSGLAEEIQKLTKKFFNAKTTDKQSIKGKIQQKITEHIEFNFELRENQYLRRIAELEGVKNLRASEVKSLEKLKTEFALLEDTKKELEKIQQKDEKPYFLWHLFFGDVLNNGGFDIVIGNPPYIEFKSLEQVVKNEIEDKNLNFYTTAIGKYDIYITFYELATRLLKNDSILCYITPTRFMNRDYGKGLRKFISNNLQVIEIIDFGDKQNFESAMTYTGIYILKKKNNSEYSFAIKNFINDEKRFESSVKLNNETWFFNDPQIEKILNQIRSNSQSLRSVLEGIYQGVATGKDEVFIINEDDIIRNNFERDYLVKFLKGKDISPYQINWKNNYCIYPYSDDGKVISEDLFKVNAPNIYQYLVKCKPLLAGRGYFDKSTKKWFELWNQRSKNKFIGPKLITLDNASRNSFAFDDESFFGTTTTYSLGANINFNIKILLAVLNSKVLDFYHKKNTIPQAGGFFRYQASFIENLPINMFANNFKILEVKSEIVTYIKKQKEKIIDIIDNEHISKFFEELIDAVVFEIYFPDEMQDKKITVISQIEDILQKHNAQNFASLPEDKKREMIAKLYFAFKESEVQKRMRQFVTASPEVLRVILQS